MRMEFVSIILTPVVAAVAGPMITLLKGPDMGAPVCKSNSKELAKHLTASLTKGLYVLWSHKLTATLTKSMALALSDRLVVTLFNALAVPTRELTLKGATPFIIDTVIKALSMTLPHIIPRSINRLLVPYLTAYMVNPLIHTLTRSVTHTLVPALSHTLRVAPEEERNCYYCEFA